LYDPSFAYQWTIRYGNPGSTLTSTSGEVFEVAAGKLQPGKRYEVSLTATDANSVSSTRIAHFFTKAKLLHVACVVPSTRLEQNLVGGIRCQGTPSAYNAGPLRYQLRAYLTAAFTVGADSWLPLSDFTTINAWDVYLPYNLDRVVLYAED